MIILLALVMMVSGAWSGVLHVQDVIQAPQRFHPGRAFGAEYRSVGSHGVSGASCEDRVG